MSKRTPCILGASFAAELWFAHVLSGHGDFLRAGEASKFVLAAFGAGLMYWLAAARLPRAELSARQSTWVFWAGTVLLRLVILPVLPGDDLWRYRWEGLIQLHGFNPYVLSPNEPALASLRDAGWLKINHRDFPAIYPPLTQAFFAAMALCGNSVWLYKLLFALTDLACCGVLRRLLSRAGGDGAQAAWYGWNPLVVYAFAGAAHFDCLMILALLGAVSALDAYRRNLFKRMPRRHRRAKRFAFLAERTAARGRRRAQDRAVGPVSHLGGRGGFLAETTGIVGAGHRTPRGPGGSVRISAHAGIFDFGTVRPRLSCQRSDLDDVGRGHRLAPCGRQPAF